MNELSARVAAWLQSVLLQAPPQIRAIYVEYGDACSRSMETLIYFNAFGFESLAGGRFDPSNRDHVAELGDFTWEPTDDCKFRADDFPNVPWMAVLNAAVRSPDLLDLAETRCIQLVIGEHDGEVFVVRRN